jgi:hypothetical protein
MKREEQQWEKSSSPKWEEVQEEPINDTENSENRIWVLCEKLFGSLNNYTCIHLNRFSIRGEPEVGFQFGSCIWKCQFDSHCENRDENQVKVGELPNSGLYTDGRAL